MRERNRSVLDEYGNCGHEIGGHISLRAGTGNRCSTPSWMEWRQAMQMRPKQPEYQLCMVEVRTCRDSCVLYRLHLQPSCTTVRSLRVDGKVVSKPEL